MNTILKPKTAPAPMVQKRGLLIISHGYPPYYGGAEHAAGYLAREANRTGCWDVTVLTSDIGGRLPAASVDDDVKITRVRTWKREWARHTTAELISFLWAARKYKPASKIDYIIANCALPAGAVAKAVSRRTGAPYGVILQGSDVPGYQNRRFGMIYEFVKPWLRSIWRDADYVAAVSEPLRQLALAVWPDGRVVVVPNGVDVEKFRPAEKGEKDRSSIRLITVAQLIERKGLRYLIDAVALLPDAIKSRATLEICGIGPCENDLRRQADRLGIGNRIQWSGLLDQDRLAWRLRAADIFILPTLQEAWPLSLLEAMASGLPVIATDTGGIKDIIRNGMDGILVNAGSAPELSRAITRLIEEPDTAQGLAQAAARRARQWSWPAIWELHRKVHAAMGDPCRER